MEIVMYKKIFKDPAFFSVCIIAALISALLSLFLGISISAKVIQMIFFYILPFLSVLSVVIIYYVFKKTNYTTIAVAVAIAVAALQYSNIISYLFEIKLDLYFIMRSLMFLALFIFEFILFLEVNNNKRYKNIYFIITFLLLVLNLLDIIRNSNNWAGISIFFLLIISLLLTIRSFPDTAQDDGSLSEDEEKGQRTSDMQYFKILRELSSLKQEGIITEEEFTQKKTKILDSFTDKT